MFGSSTLAQQASSETCWVCWEVKAPLTTCRPATLAPGGNCFGRWHEFDLCSASCAMARPLALIGKLNFFQYERFFDFRSCRRYLRRMRAPAKWQFLFSHSLQGQDVGFVLPIVSRYIPEESRVLRHSSGSRECTQGCQET